MKPKKYWWRMTGSNRRPPACKAGALPAELIPIVWNGMVGLVGLEPTTPALSRRCSNQLSYRPKPVAADWALTRVVGDNLPTRLPCYDFTPVTNPAVVIALLAVRLTTSGRTRSHGVTGGVYKTRERIHRDILIRDY